MNKRKLLVWIPVAALLLNGLGYLIYTKGRTSSRAVPEASRNDRPGSGVAEPRAEQPAADPSGRGAPPDDGQDKEKAEKALARRAAGLAALEAGNYDSALINFTEARALLGDKANVADLLRVTQDLRKSNRPVTRPREAPPVREPVVARTKSRANGESRLAMREPSPPPESNEVQASPASGLLIVTTTPRGLLVQVDDTPIDLTPMRTKVRPGVHRVALLDGDRKVYETTVDVREGTTATLLKDLAPDMSPEPSRAAPPGAAAPSPLAAKVEPVRQVVAPDEAPAPPRTTAAGQLAATPGGNGTGALEISSPGLYGIVWINGRPRGYPPLTVRDVPVGEAKVEVRVNGIQKRSATVVVKPVATTSIKLRSRDNVP